MPKPGLAPHVQAALQAKLSHPVSTSRPPAPHVQAALQRGIQAKPQFQAPSRQPLAAHVQAAVDQAPAPNRGGPIQPKAAVAGQKSPVIQARWLAIDKTGVKGTWKKGKGDAPNGDYVHVGDHVFRKSDEGKLSSTLYKWNPKDDALQSLRETRDIGTALKEGRYDTPTAFENEEATERHTNLTLYGLQANPKTYLVYDLATNKLVMKTSGEADIELAWPKHLDPKGKSLNRIKVDGKNYFRMTGKRTGLEDAGKVFFYLTEQAENASPSKTAAQSPTGIKVNETKQMNDLITEDNIKVWEPIKTRSMTQKSVMGNSSAKDEAAALGMTEGEWHWCHLIAHSMGALGNPQVPENLVAGTAACNGAMAHLEQGIKKFVTESGRGLRVKVTAQLIPPTHVAKKITYEVEDSIANGKAVFYFDPLNPNKSAIQHADLYAALLVDKLKVGIFSPDTPKRSETIRALTGEKHFETPVKKEKKKVLTSSPLLDLPSMFSPLTSSATTTAFHPTSILKTRVAVSFESGVMTSARVKEHLGGNNYLLELEPNLYVFGRRLISGSFEADGDVPGNE